MEKPINEVRLINMAEFDSRVCMGPGSVSEAEHRALRDITKPTSRYKRVVVGDEVYPGADVVSVFGPDQESPAWMIVFADGTKIHTTHPVTVVENAQ